MASLKEFLSSEHSLYRRYKTDWRLTYNAYIGGVEWRKGQYLKAYKVDFQTPSDTVNIHNVTETGDYLGKSKAQVNRASSAANAEAGLNQAEGTFYHEKLHNTPVYPYVRLYVSEYNSILFKNAPVRKLYEDDSIMEEVIDNFTKDVDGEGNSLNEFWSQVDILTTVFGVVWISCVKPTDSEYPLFAIHNPLDVINWEYGYRTDGKLELRKIAIVVGDDEQAVVYRVFTPSTIETVWIPKDTTFNIDLEGIIADDGMYRFIENNELGYIPINPVYQSMKVFNGIGHTPIFDIAQIQRSIYGYSAEIYAGITYGAHPVNIVDEATIELNGGSVGAEPGTTVIVPTNGVPGQNPYAFEFKAPPIESLSEMRALIDQMIEKMNTVAMIRSEDLIKASRSGAQIEQYDTKLEAFVRKKATSLENAEYRMWVIWHDWMNQDLYSDFAITYNKMYGNKGIENELKTTQMMLDLVERMKPYYSTVSSMPADIEETPMYPHQMVNPESGESVTVNDDSEHNQAMANGYTEHPDEGEIYPETPEYESQEEYNDMIEAIKTKIKHIIDSSYTENSE